MQIQEQKLLELIEDLGISLIHKLLSKHEATVNDILPHLEKMSPHELNTVMSVANGLMATKAASPKCPQGQVWNGSACVDDVG